MPVCFSIEGLPHDFAIAMANRMIDDAQAASVPLAGRGCSPNVYVYVADGASEGFQKARRTIEPKARSDAPALVGFTTAERSRDGDQKRPALSSGSFAGWVTLKVPSATRLGIYARTDIDIAVIVLRSDAAVGKTPQQLADYVVMRTLAQTGDYTGRGDTILSLFAGREPLPDGLTPFDTRYLKTLYRGPAAVDAASKLATISRDVGKQ